MIDLPLKAAGSSQPTQYNLQTCIERALVRNPSALFGQISVEDAKSILNWKEADQNVKISLKSDLGYYNGEGIGPGSLVSGSSNEGVIQENASGNYYNAIINATLPLYEKGAFFNMPNSDVRKADIGVRLAQWNKLNIYQTVTEEVITAYIRVLKETKSVTTYKEIVSLAASAYDLAQAEFKHNFISNNDLLTAETQLKRFESKLSVYKISHDYSMKNMALIISEEQAGGFVFEDVSDLSVKLPEFKILLESIIQSHPEIKAQELKIEMSQEEVNNVLSQGYPTVLASMDYGIGDDFSGSLSDLFIAAIKLEVPLFDGGVRKKKIAYYRKQVLLEKNRLLESKLKITQELEEIHLSLLSLEEEINLLNKQIEQAREESKLNQAKFEQNLRSAAAKNDSKIKLLELLLDRYHAIYDKLNILLVLNTLYQAKALEK